MFKSIKTVLNELVKDLGIKDEVEGNRAFVVWDEVVGDAVARNAQPRLLKRGILFIETTSSAWAQELSFMRQRLIDALNERLGKNLIKEIRLKATIAEEMPLALSKEISLEVMEDLREVKLEPEDLTEIGAAVKDIKDAGLREELKKLMVVDRKRKKAKPKVK